MARLELVLSDGEKRQLAEEATARGVTMTALVKERVFGRESDDRVEDHERRLARLEEMAGL